MDEWSASNKKLASATYLFMSIYKFTYFFNMVFLFWIQRTFIQKRQILPHLFDIFCSHHAHIHRGVRKHIAVALRCREGLLSFRHFFGLHQLAPSCSGKTHNARPVILVEIGKNFFFCTAMGSVIAHMTNIDIFNL